MLWVFLSLLGLLLFLFVKDQFTYGMSRSTDKPLPLKGILVSGALFYLLSRGFISEEEEQMLESMNLEELEGYIMGNEILTKQEWMDLILEEYDMVTFGDFEKDMPLN
ncbi:hypothetical protein [Sutcliffiella halmapala]|uniref:hypothetical protein n=1 Tax=Sutcliffiella halmapala TaxID=79882 RepID=UPI000994DF41|nr:hypothetical protein [Sutcliffiella halmapala]